MRSRQTTSREFPRGTSQEFQAERKCPDDRVCVQCKDRQSCIYHRREQRLRFLRELLGVITSRVQTADNGCLVNVRQISHSLAKKLDTDERGLPKLIDQVFTELRIPLWGNACSDYRLETWNVRPNASKVYQIDKSTPEVLRWYLEQVESWTGRTAFPETGQVVRP